MEFQVIYSRKIQGAVILFTVFMFACQYGLTRETVAENFSRTGICWSEFALNVVFSILLIFLVWDDDYILSDESITVRRVIFCKKHKWNEFPYCGICYKKNENADDRNEKLLYFSNKPESDSKFFNTKSTGIILKSYQFTTIFPLHIQRFIIRCKNPYYFIILSFIFKYMYVIHQIAFHFFSLFFLISCSIKILHFTGFVES